MNAQRFEILALCIGKMNGAWDDPDSKAFKLRNPLLLKTYRPEKQCDSDHYRIFTSLMGGLKAGIADLHAKCNGKSNRLTPENTLRDVFAVFGFANEITARKMVLFLRRALQDENISLNTQLNWLLEPAKIEEKQNGGSKPDQSE
jgi:hypothetical protein